MEKRGMYSLFLLSIFLIFTTDTDECEVTHGKCHEKAICNNTHGSYVNLDISEMDRILQVQSTVSKATDSY